MDRELRKDEGKNSRGHGHAFESPEGGQGLFLRTAVFGQGAGHQDVFNGAQDGVQVSAGGDGGGDGQQAVEHAVALLHRRRRGDFHLAAVMEIPGGQVQAGGDFRQGIAQHDGHAGEGQAEDGEAIDEKHHHPDTHDLLENLSAGGGGGFPGGR